MVRAHIEIKQHLVPADKWHWCVVFDSGHIYAISDTFDTVEACATSVVKDGVAKLLECMKL